MTLSFVSFYKYIDCDRLKFSYQVHCGYKVLWSACVCNSWLFICNHIFKNICPSFSNFSMESNQFFRPRTFLSSLSCIWFLVTGVFFMLLLPLFRCLFKICYDCSVTVNNRGSVFRLFLRPLWSIITVRWSWNCSVLMSQMYDLVHRIDPSAAAEPCFLF